MTVTSFRDLIAWQKAQDVTLKIYEDFASCKDWAFRDQIQRATISISNNIAEGHARRSEKAFKNFLFIALGSTAEVESMLILATKLKYIPEDQAPERITNIQEVAKLINGLVRKLSADS